VSKQLLSFLLVGVMAGPAAAQVTTSTEAVTAATIPVPPQTSSAGVAELERQVQVLASEVERLKIGEAAIEADTVKYGMGPAASKVYRGHGISLGGYGEVQYNNFAGKDDQGNPSGKRDTIDTLRAVLYTGYKFNDKIIFNSEIEFEHGGDEVSVEFAYLDYLLNPAINLRVGKLLLPVGLVNELHEPTTFLPVRKAETEQRIIPSTWSENGAGVFGDVGPLSYRAAVVAGLNGGDGTEPRFSASGIRESRQEGREAIAEDWGFVGRVDVTGIPGLLVGVSAYQGQADQTKTQKIGELHIEMPVLVYDAHFAYKISGFTLRALAARTELKNAVDYNRRFGLAGADGVGKRMQGYYVESDYDVLSLFNDIGEQSLSPFVRWEALNTQLLVPVNAKHDPAQDVKIATLGIAYQPIDQVILKGDYQNYSNKAHTASDQFNVSAGYVF
jgi:hypothetical protein